MPYLPRVSIGLCVYNGQRYLSKTLDSILAQSLQDFELIISDNASSDGTEEICRRYASRDKRIQYSRNPTNIGLSNNFNRVVYMSSGRYFRWSSSDDMHAPQSLQACVKVLDDHPEVVLCYPKTVLIDSEGNIQGNYDDKMDLRSSSVTKRFRHVIEHLGLVNIHYGLIRTDVLRRTLLFGGYPGGDMPFIAELSLYGQFWELPEPLFFRRMHDETTSALNERPWSAQEELWNGIPGSDVDLYYWNHRLHNIRSLVRAPIGFFQKLCLSSFIVEYIFRSREAHLRELRDASVHLFGRARPDHGDVLKS